MKKFMTTLMVLSLCLLPIQVEAKGNNHHRHQHKQALQLHDTMRVLWTDHAIWTRDYIKSAMAGLEDQDAVLGRLLRNQDDIGNAIKPYYGDKAGARLSELLREHIVLAGKIVEAVKNNNQSDAQKFSKEWYRNADDLAEFLSKANPNWQKEEMKKLLYVHLKMVSDDLAATKAKDWTGEIAAFDKGLAHLLMFADVLSNGIVQQCPNKF